MTLMGFHRRVLHGSFKGIRVWGLRAVLITKFRIIIEGFRVLGLGFS